MAIGEPKMIEKNDKLHITTDTSLIPDPAISLVLTDSFALILLRDFIFSGFPSLDPLAQVNAAYTYAEVMVERRKKL
jgi:hypothetical protein